MGSARFLPRGKKSALHAPALARPATVVRNWCHVANGGDREAHGLQRPQRALTPRAGPADLDLQHFHPVLARLAASILGGHLSGVRRRLAAALEPLAARGRPGDRVALSVGDGDDGVVERRGDVGDTGRDILALLPAGARGRSGGSRHDAKFLLLLIRGRRSPTTW